MGRNRGKDVVHVEAQDFGAVGLHPTDNGNRGSSSLDLNAPHSQPRHSRSGEAHRAPELSTHRRSSNCQENPAQSLARDNAGDVSLDSVMPPPPQRRLNRSSTAPLEQRRRRHSIDEDDLEEERSLLVRRHSERLESPRRERRSRYKSPSESELEIDSDSESDLGDESDLSDHRQHADHIRDRIEVSDDERPTYTRRRNDAGGPSRHGGREHVRGRDEDSMHSRSDGEHNDSRALVVRDEHQLNQNQHHESQQPEAHRRQHRRRSHKVPGDSRARHGSQRTFRRPEQHDQTADDTVRSQRESTVASSRSSSASLRRPTNVLSTFFKPPPTPKRQSKHAASGSVPKGSPAHAERVECVICMSDVSIKKAAHLKCDHHMCNTCLKRAFTLSVEDSTHMPPKCCTKDHIQPKHVERLFDLTFKKTWNRKFVEYTTKNRLYCPAKRCGHFIKPSRIKGDKGRRYARCGHCDTKVCARCNNRWHKTVDCPTDNTINDFLAQAKEEGWQRCYQCRAMVELREGCNHMTCRCGAEFCMICGSKWKSCDCPWFNDEAIAADRRRHMNEGPPPQRGRIEDIFHGEGPPMPPELRGMAGFGPAPHVLAQMPHGYGLDALRDFRRAHENEDADLARRISVYGNLDDNYSSGTYHAPGGSMANGTSNSVHQQASYHYHRGSQSMVNPSMPPNWDRSSVADYVSEVSRARGVREDSMERRLADRLAERPMLHSAAMHPISGSSIGQLPQQMYSYAGVPSSGRVDPVTGMPVLMQSYPLTTPPVAIDMRYSGLQSTTPLHSSMPNYDECYEQQRIEVNTPRRRRRAQERERGRRSSSSAVATSNTEVKSSSLAGLTGPGRGMDRVAEWSYHVAPGVPASTVGDEG